jgi:hypothetical protein
MLSAETVRKMVQATQETRVRVIGDAMAGI